ncbi:hypothetical protein EGM51_13945 [Verrucomicrobia bacterium S94]|nr:hypothetical protein EGM51_13945 [Verrucomicrobia bacterium S94]
MTRCKHCKTKTDLIDNRCPCCGIEAGKNPADLTKAEKRVLFHALGIRAAAIAHVFAAGVILFQIPHFPSPAVIAVLVIINAGLAYGLLRFSLAAYRAAVVYYFMFGMVNVVSIQRGPEHLGGLLLCLLALYLIGNRTSKAIFERQLPETL